MINSSDLSLIKEFPHDTSIESLWANSKQIIVAQASGQLDIYEWNLKLKEGVCRYENAKTEKYDFPLKAIKVTQNDKILVAYCENRLGVEKEDG